MGKDGSGEMGNGGGGQGPTGGIGSGGQAEYGETVDGFTPDSVKGKMDPKGRMGVTTFRGVPKPGELTVEMREDVARERSDAESAIDQDQIPR